jgi:hypothetical protein
MMNKQRGEGLSALSVARSRLTGVMNWRRGCTVNNVIEYEGEVLPDGNLPIPQEVRQQLAATPHTMVRVVIQILAPSETTAAKQLEDAWEAFDQLGQSPAPGRLPEASVRHDEYLYGKKRS